MNIKRNMRIVLINVVIFIILLSGIGFTYATTSQELKNKQKNIDEQIAEKKEEMKNVKNELSDTLTQINKLNVEISDYQTEINELNAQIGTLDIQITEKEANIDEQQKKFDAQKTALEERLVAMYESGTVSYLDMLLSSEGITDFISNYYLISEIAKADNELLDNIENTKNQIENEKNSLQDARNQRNESKTAVEGKKQTLASSVNQKNQLAANLTEEEKAIQAELDEFEKDKQRIQAELAALAAKDNVKPVAPSAAGYISPLAGKTKANITTGYGSYQTRSGKHTGVDFACSGGTPIYAVKAGTVITSKALTYPNGSYKSYGEYIVINHHDGTMTLYGHMQSGSRCVSEGQAVAQGQQIGRVGSTGNSTGNHLHFEVRVGGSPVNPIPYLP